LLRHYYFFRFISLCHAFSPFSDFHLIDYLLYFSCRFRHFTLSFLILRHLIADGFIFAITLPLSSTLSPLRCHFLRCLHFLILLLSPFRFMMIRCYAFDDVSLFTLLRFIFAMHTAAACHADAFHAMLMPFSR